MFLYPWGDTHSLNLGWFLLQFKDWVEKIQEYLDNGGGTSENLANVIAPVFNAANYYQTGDYVLYNDELYKANQPVNPGTWNPDAWDNCLIVDEMGSGGGAGVDIVARLMIAGEYSPLYAYQKNAICRYNDKLWMCNTNLPSGGEAWDPTHWDEITVGAGLTGLKNGLETALRTITESPLTSANDLNDYRTNGMYRIGATVPANCPAGSWSQLIVTNVGSTRIQTLYNTNNSQLVIYQRSGGDTTWNSWQKISTGDFVANRKNAKITSVSVRGGNLLAFGDSWAEGYRASAPNKTFPAQLAAKLGMTPINKAVGSSGFMVENNLVSTQITNAASTMTATEKEQTSIIVILAGINDIRLYHNTKTAAEFGTAVANTLALCASTFPEIPIVLCLGNGYVSAPPSFYYNWINTAKETIEKASINTQITIIDSLTEFLTAQTDLYYTGDNLHLNDTGYDALAGYVANVISGGTPSIYRVLGNMIPDAGITLTNAPVLIQNNRQIILSGGRFDFGGNNAQSKWLGTIPQTGYAPGSSIIIPAFFNRQLVGVFEITAQSGRCAFYTSAVYKIIDGGTEKPVTQVGIPYIDTSEIAWTLAGSWAWT